jgi:stage II sporulation SpoAA-like protein
VITELPDMPDGVIGFQASGEVSADDYKNVLVPAIDRAVESGGKVRLVYELGADYEGFEAGGVWQDLRVGTSHFYSFGRVALVTDVDWMRRATKAFGFLMPGEIKVFGLGERADAARWAAAD